MKATQQYFRVVLFIVQYRVVQRFGSVDKILKYDHLCWARRFSPLHLQTNDQ